VCGIAVVWKRKGDLILLRELNIFNFVYHVMLILWKLGKMIITEAQSTTKYLLTSCCGVSEEKENLI